MKIKLLIILLIISNTSFGNFDKCVENLSGSSKIEEEAEKLLQFSFENAKDLVDHLDERANEVIKIMSRPNNTSLIMDYLTKSKNNLEKFSIDTEKMREYSWNSYILPDDMKICLGGLCPDDIELPTKESVTINGKQYDLKEHIELISNIIYNSPVKTDDSFVIKIDDELSPRHKSSPYKLFGSASIIFSIHENSLKIIKEFDLTTLDDEIINLYVPSLYSNSKAPYSYIVDGRDGDPLENLEWDLWRKECHKKERQKRKRSN